MKTPCIEKFIAQFHYIMERRLELLCYNVKMLYL